MLNNLWRKYGINPFDTLLRRAKEKNESRFLVCWNRGLGDIPLGLYGLIYRIRQYLPEAQITFATRSDLAQGFELLDSISTLIDPEWKRGVPFNLDKTLAMAGLNRSDFDVILEHPDPTGWLIWQLGKLTPKLNWSQELDPLFQRFLLDPFNKYIGLHVQTETNYAYEKNWPLSYWKEFCRRIYHEHDLPIILFGFAQDPPFEEEGIVDLRGQTTLLEMLSIIKNKCRYLLVPDSGLLSMTYYIDASFPLDIVSLWADPKQGVLKQNVPSPNPQLHHRPLIAFNKDLRTVSVESAIEALLIGVNR